MVAEAIGATLSRGLGFGGAPLGNLYRAVDPGQARALVRHAYDAGMRYFDTAPHYGHGLSEQRIGEGLSGLSRASYVLSTKVGRLLLPDASAPRTQFGYVDTPPLAQRYDYSADGVRRSLAESMVRLRTDRIDIVYVHDIDRETHGEAHAARLADALDGALPALAELKREGAISAFGLGVNDVGICLDVLAHADLDMILLAGRYTLADQSALSELLPECRRRGVAIVLGGAYNSGILATGARPADGSAPYFNYAPAPPAIIQRVTAIEGVCRDFGVPLPAAALQFPRAHPAVATIVVGVRSAAELDQSLRWSRWPVPADFWRSLRGRSLIDPAAPLPTD